MSVRSLTTLTTSTNHALEFMIKNSVLILGFPARTFSTWHLTNPPTATSTVRMPQTRNAAKQPSRSQIGTRNKR